jgi:hypothetical protein
MTTFFQILLFVLILTSPVIWVFWQFEPEDSDGKEKKGQYVIFLGTMLAFMIIIGEGFESLLTFIPESRGYYDKGEFITLRSSIAYFVSFWPALAIMDLASKKRRLDKESLELEKENLELENENFELERKNLEMEIKFLKKLKKIKHLSPAAHKARLASLERKLEKMESRLILTEEQKEDLQTYWDIIYELEE